jgi:hypothetical protein
LGEHVAAQHRAHARRHDETVARGHIDGMQGETTAIWP